VKRLMLLALLAAALSAFLIGVLGTSAHADGPLWDDYSTALGAGLISPADQYDSQRDPATCVPQTGWNCTGPLMYCTNNGATDGGYSTASALESAISADSSGQYDCTTDPRTVAVGVGSDPSLELGAPDQYANQASKAYAAQDSTGIFHSGGVRSGIETGAPTGPTSTNGARINATIWVHPDYWETSNPHCLRSHEVGWLYGQPVISKYNDGKPHVYTASNGGKGTNGSGQNCPSGWSPGDITTWGYAIQTETYYAYKIVDTMAGTQAWLFWLGGWHALGYSGAQTDFRCRSGTSVTCNVQAGIEVLEGFDQNGNPVWPAQNDPDDGIGTNFKNIWWYDGGLNHNDWTSSKGASTTSPQNGYRYCTITNYTAFRTPRASSC